MAAVKFTSRAAKNQGPPKRGAKSKADLILENKELFSVWASQGLTDKEIAENLGVSLSTYYKQKSSITEFSDTLKEARKIAIKNVENELYRRCIGFEYEESPTITVGGNNEKPLVKKVKKRALFDIGAIKFFLVNRDKGNWKNVQSDLAPVDEGSDSIDEMLDCIRKAATKK